MIRNLFLRLHLILCQIMQGIAPIATGSLSDRRGRRPILFVCMSICVIASIGLACQNNFVGLMLLRCLQSIGCSGTFTSTFALVVDIIARSERGKYLAYITIGSTIGTSTGPIIGGVLTHKLGWRSIFWFLTICSAISTLMIIVLLRETCRAVVGNGSIPPPAWNKPLYFKNSSTGPDYETKTKFTSPPRILDCFKIFWKNQEVGLLIFCWSLMCWGQTVIEISLPVVLGKKYHLDPLKVGLCYIPWATGAIAARWSIGSLGDWNFRRLGRKAGLDIQSNKQTKAQLRALPLERIRLQIVLPAVYVACTFTVAYSWAAAVNVHIACPLVLLFFLGNAMTGTTNTLSALIGDLEAYKPGTVRGAMAIFKCLPGAGVAAGINPAIASIGFGWFGSIISGVWVASSGILWFIYFHGQKWRDTASREDEKKRAVETCSPRYA